MIASSAGYELTLRTGLAVLILTCLALSLSSCAVPPPFPCTVESWEKTGKEDGLKGYPPQTFARHAEACQSEGIVPDNEGYKAGYLQGITEFCNPYRAQLAGARGKPFAGNLCPRKLARSYNERYAAGQRITQINRVVSVRRKQVAQLTEDMNYAYTDLEQRKIKQQVSFLINEITSLEREKEQLASANNNMLFNNEGDLEKEAETEATTKAPLRKSNS